MPSIDGFFALVEWYLRPWRKMEAWCQAASGEATKVADGLHFENSSFILSSVGDTRVADEKAVAVAVWRTLAIR